MFVVRQLIFVDVENGVEIRQLFSSLCCRDESRGGRGWWRVMRASVSVREKQVIVGILAESG